MIDFGKFNRPTIDAAPRDPIEIFKRSPNLGNAPNDLWEGQAQALKQWHSSRENKDNLIILNTGAGKSIVGALIAQSLTNEDIGPVLFACSTIDLVRQTARECDRLGIKYTQRTKQKFDNDLFESGKAFCITTYQSLFSSINVFTKDKSPAAVIFDDAHVSERMIRDAFTLTIRKEKHENLFNNIIDIVRPEFEAIGKNGHLSYVLESIGQVGTTMCPPCTAARNKEQIINALKKARYQDDRELQFPVIQLYENLQYCAIFISKNTIEVTPPFIPTGKFPFLSGDVRRVYLSATLDFETDFVRGFGRRATNEIKPNNDAGNGERLILFGDKLHPEIKKTDTVKDIASARKILVAVPSYPDSKPWSSVAVPPDVDKFSEALETFRAASKGAFLLVSRIDGIDLPQDTCRIMAIDGSPSGVSLMERHLVENLQMNNLMSTKMATRITQLFGRINRGRSDYGVFLIFGKDISTWLRRDKNIALLPELIRKQILLGKTIHEEIPFMEKTNFFGLLSQVLDIKDGKRDESWLRYYSDTMQGVKFDNEILEKVKIREKKIADGVLAECEFMTALWQGDVPGARIALEDVIDKIAIADARIAGWYSIWLGMTYEMAGDISTAGQHYRKARSRLSKWLNLPYTVDTFDIQNGLNIVGSIHKNFVDINLAGTAKLADLSAQLKAALRKLKDPNLEANDHEEALRAIGELLGLEATRPDNEFDAGPDVLWHDPLTNYSLAMELKTKKENPALYFKKDIGQSLNHIEWMNDNRTGDEIDGILIVGPPGKCHEQANPSDELYLCEIDNLVGKIEGFIAKLDDFRGRTTAERTQIIADFGSLKEWQLDGWFSSLATARLKELR
ncbi:DEAD/DEAH box helicase family protein [Rhizobium sp. CNPSo 4062]|uniref:DEAD/DEAH box helicase family protein n=1 Tax=Rhizobium sp. CNPSo 4062 TaxID=3021410 RepID=UPI00254F0A56|nr:DEAD/DEAH box helicase family protein [Rhizobium sp. CNPSo 4062]MDK4703716.1 DEAD/DEAH box helicase family protein [Rhizobium sp. CNPSo 4062]